MIHASTHENIREAASILQNGGIVAVPTETVYGLAGSIYKPEAIAEIFRRKGRPQDNPLIVHVASIDQAASLTTKEGTAVIEKFGSALWPGPLTLVVPCSHSVPSAITAGLDTIALRMPAKSIFLDLIRAVGSPLAAPSANVSGRPSPTRAEHVLEDLGEDVFILDGGSCEYGIESTVIRILDGRIHLLRPGAISAIELEQQGGAVVVRSDTSSTSDVVRSPGTKYRHYAPAADVILCQTAGEVHTALHRETGSSIVLAPEEYIAEFSSHAVRELSTATLFDELRRADSLQTQTIVVLCNESVMAHEALYNRLLKAAGKD
jgi:L-threonylcarbamoyladenylate synthase